MRRYYDGETGLYFEVGDGEAVVADSDKTLTETVIPEYFLETLVRRIKKKAFLGCKLLRTVSMPASVESVGEWAFASCSSLSDFSMKGRSCRFGQGAFRNDDKLESLLVEGAGEDCARLLAKAVTVMEAEYLLEPASAGTEEWFAKWDGKLSDILNRKDDEGYHLYVLCGEEDLHFDYDEYLEYNRRKKAGLSMIRLLYDKGLSESLKERLREYVKGHSVGENSEAAWKHILSAHGNDLEYYRLMIELGGIGRENLEKALSDLSDRHAEAKAFLINHFNTEDRAEDVFDSLLL